MNSRMHGLLTRVRKSSRINKVIWSPLQQPNYSHSLLFRFSPFPSSVAKYSVMRISFLGGCSFHPSKVHWRRLLRSSLRRSYIGSFGCREFTIVCLRIEFEIYFNERGLMVQICNSTVIIMSILVSLKGKETLIFLQEDVSFVGL